MKTDWLGCTPIPPNSYIEFQGSFNLLLLQLFNDNFMKRQINQLIVKCRTVKNGKECAWKGKLQSIEVSICSCWYTKRHTCTVQYVEKKYSFKRELQWLFIEIFPKLHACVSRGKYCARECL